MIELLKLFGFDTQEIETELHRIERAFDKLGITAADIERGKQRLTKYYDIELVGIRKILRLLIQDIVDTVLAREEGKKIVYGFMAPGFTTFGSAIISNSKDIYATYLCQQFQVVMGAIFDKIVPVFEAAERKWHKAGAVAHCGNVKSLVGLFAMDIIPKPDFLVTTGYLCDTAPKTIDLLHELYDIPTCCYTTCQDRDFGEYSAATKRISSLGAQTLRRCTERLKEVVGFEITDDMLWEVRNAMSEFNNALGKLQDLIGNTDPLLLSANHQVLWFCLGSATISLDHLPDAIDAVTTLHKELQERANRGQGVVEKGAPRILAILPSHYTDPRLDHLVSELGMAIAGIDLFMVQSNEKKPEDLYEIITSENIGVSFTQSSRRRIPLIIEECKRLNVDGVLNRYHVGCRSVTGDAILIKEAITKELGIPVMLMERDDFDPRSYDYDQYKRNLEVFKSMMKTKSG